MHRRVCKRAMWACSIISATLWTAAAMEPSGSAPQHYHHMGAAKAARMQQDGVDDSCTNAAASLHCSNSTGSSKGNDTEASGAVADAHKSFQLPVEVSGEQLALDWEPSSDLWATAKLFRQGHSLMAPPDCAGKQTMAELEFCTDDHLVMFMQREMMTRELQERKEEGCPTCQMGLFDFERLFGGAGGHYSHYENYIFFRGVLERNPALLPTAIEMLRACAKKEPRFAPTIHTLTNALYDQYTEMSGEAERMQVAQEISSWLHGSLGLGGQQQQQGEEGPTARTHESPITSCSRLDDAAAAPPTVHIVTVASGDRPALRTLRASVLATIGHNLTVLGMGQPWRGLGSKVFLLRDYLSSSSLRHHDCDLLAFVDAYDVIFLPSAAQLIERFHRAITTTSTTTSEPILFSAETACSPDKGMKVLYEQEETRHDPTHSSSSPFKYINSGTYMGRVGSIRAMLDSVLHDLHQHHGYSGADVLELDDQRWFTRFFFREAGRAVMDVNAMVFHTLFQLSMEDFTFRAGGGERDQEEVLTSRVTGTQPCILHGNGGAFKEVFGRLQAEGWPPQQQPPSH